MLGCLGTPHQTLGACHWALTYTMASKCINFAGLLAVRKHGIKKGQSTKLHLFSVCYIPIAGLLRLEVSRTKGTNKSKANIRQMPHALTCLDTPLSPFTWCLIAWEPRALASTNCHEH